MNLLHCQRCDTLTLDLKDIVSGGTSGCCINPSICDKYIYFRGLQITPTKWISYIIMYDKMSGSFMQTECSVPCIDNIEDLRIFDWNDKVYFIGYQRNKYHVFETFVGYFSDNAERIERIEYSFKTPFVHVKNLVPLIHNDELYIIDVYLAVVYRKDVKVCALEGVPRNLCGSTQFLRLAADVFGGIVHERVQHGQHTIYMHYWIEIDTDAWRVTYISIPFSITGDGHDFITGINQIDGGRYQLMFGYKDQTIMRTEVRLEDLRNVKKPIRVLHVSRDHRMWTNLDAIAHDNGWHVTHVRPPHDQEMTAEIAKHVWDTYYGPYLKLHKDAFTHIIVSDSMQYCVPFADYVENNKHVRLVVHVMHHRIDCGNTWLWQTLTHVTELPNVSVVYVTPDIKEGHLPPGRHLPLSGKTVAVEYPSHVWEDAQAFYHTSLVPIDAPGYKVCVSSLPEDDNAYTFISQSNVYRLQRPELLFGSAASFDAIVYFPSSSTADSALHALLSAGIIVILASRYEYIGPCASVLTYFASVEEYNQIIDNVYNNPVWVDNKRREIREFMHTYDGYIIDVWKSIVY